MTDGMEIVLVDDAAPVAELVAERLARDLRCHVTVFQEVRALIAARPPHDGWAVAIIDLSFQQSELGGIDALLHLWRTQPDTKLVLFTQGDEYVKDQLRDAWDAIPLASVVSKSMPMADFVDVIRRVARDGEAPVDPVIRPLLPTERSPWRSITGYERLVQHAGHAKLWRALLDTDDEPSYRELAVCSGLSVNTVRNYRDQLLGELRLHGLDNPTMRQMQTFARRCRPFLQPLLDRRSV